MKQSMSIEITIPVLNEETTLESKVSEVILFLENSIIDDYSIIISDNGSTDKTPDIGKALDSEFENVSYLKVSKKGVGLALKTSWMQSQADIVGYMDLDLSTDLDHLIEVYNSFILSDSVIVNGSRLLKNSKVINRTTLREITSRCFNFFVKRILNVKFTDGMCGFKFFKREIAQEAIKKGIPTDGWIFSTEIITKLYWSGYRIDELGVKWTDNPNSKVNIIKLSKTYFKHLFKLRKERAQWLVK